MSLVIAFSGQGSQHNKMFNLLKADTFGKVWLQEASDILQVNLFDESAVEKACTDVVAVQCLIVVLSVGIYNALKKQINIDPAFLCGYSLGEISAFCASTQMSLVNICEVVSKRALFMVQARNLPGGLAVLKGNINIAQVTQLINKHGCYIAIINDEDHYIIGGNDSAIDTLLVEANARGIVKSERLIVKLPSHTPLLGEATAQFSSYLQSSHIGEMQYPILNALTQELISSRKDMLVILAKELSETLHWNNVMRIAAEYGTSCFLELGPGAALKNMFTRTFPALKAYNAEGFSSLKGCVEFLRSSEL